MRRVVVRLPFSLAGLGPVAFSVRMERTVFLGTYTHGESEGIYSCRFDAATGLLSDYRLAAKTPSPSFLALHPEKEVLYAVNETRDYEGTDSGSVTAFRIMDRERGILKQLNTKSSHGGSPCHLALSPKGRSLVTANYHGGTVGVLAVEPDGSLGKTLGVITHNGSSANKARQEGPHPHAINLSPDGRFVFVTDLGLDEILCYPLGADGSLGERQGVTKVSPGAGPRHFAFHPDGRYAYVINELNRTVTAFRYDRDTASLEEIQEISTVPDGWTSGSTAELVAHPNGKFLYGSNRGHDSIACFAIDQETGKLETIEIEKTGGNSPRNFALDPSGEYVIAANQASGDLHVFSIDPETGALNPAAGRIEMPAPVCVLFA